MESKDRTSGNRGCISYLGPNQPVFPENDPVKAYARYLGNFTPPTTGGGSPMPDLAAEQLLLRRKSALDFMRADLDRLARRLPGDERVRLERHLESLRDLERQLAPPVASGGAECKPMSPASTADYKTQSRLQIDNMFMALACGQSRLAHLIWAGETSQQPHPWLGFNDLHHDLSHRDNEPAVKAKLTKIIPFVLAGLGGGALKGGRFLTYDVAHNQLLVSILHLMGFPDQNTFGDPDWSGPLPGLLS